MENQVPELSADQKIRLLMLHRQAVVHEVNAHHKLQEAQGLFNQSQDALKEFYAVITKMADELKIDPVAFGFDVDTLRFVPRKG